MHTRYYVMIEIEFNLEFLVDKLGQAPHAFYNRGQAIADELKELNLDTYEDPRPIYVRMILSPLEEKSYLELFLKNKDVFA